MASGNVELARELYCACSPRLTNTFIADLQLIARGSSSGAPVQLAAEVAAGG